MPQRERHGMAGHPAYRAWIDMHRRCSSSVRPGAHRYAGRGITVCPEWARFTVFWREMGPSWQPGLTIERIDNDAGYTPANCRWATQHEQSRNRSTNHVIATPWGRMTLADAAARIGLHRTALLRRLQAGGPDPFRPPRPHQRTPHHDHRQ